MSFNGRTRPVWTVAVGGAGAAMVLVAGCSGGDTGSLRSNQSAPVTITPANGAGDARPDAPIEVKAADGKLQDVTVQGPNGAAVEGRMAGDRKSWRSIRNLAPGAQYNVTARAKDGGKVNTATSSFKTTKGKGTFSIQDITPGLKGESVGVGMPIIVKFSRPITEKAAVERALKVTAQKPVEGAWRWTAPDEVIYRTKAYWPAHQQVRFTAQITGVQGAKGVYGSQDKDHTLKVGAAQITTGDISKHKMTITRDGRKLRTIPFSAGNGETREYTTTSGVHLLMEKGNPVKMVSPGRQKGDPGYYEQTVNYAVRFSNSGEYVHSAPWSVGSQGSSNVSHGCVNVSPSNAKWYYDEMQRGDVIDLTGTDREVEPDNGWGFWQLSFDKWKKGSALS